MQRVALSEGRFWSRWAANCHPAFPCKQSGAKKQMIRIAWCLIERYCRYYLQRPGTIKDPITCSIESSLSFIIIFYATFIHCTAYTYILYLHELLHYTRCISSISVSSFFEAAVYPKAESEQLEDVQLQESTDVDCGNMVETCVETW